jgi:hypothetical protein
VADYVIDTNVWVMVDEPIAEIDSTAKIDCIQACRGWLRDFMSGQDHLVLDDLYLILGEYRRQIGQRRLAQAWLNQLQRAPRDRLVEVHIEVDDDGFAKVPPHLAISDEDDRTFVAVALAHTPTPPIVDATDTDWTKDKAMLEAGGIHVQELCPDYLRELLDNKAT